MGVAAAACLAVGLARRRDWWLDESAEAPMGWQVAGKPISVHALSSMPMTEQLPEVPGVNPGCTVYTVHMYLTFGYFG